MDHGACSHVYSTSPLITPFPLDTWSRRKAQKEKAKERKKTVGGRGRGRGAGPQHQGGGGRSGPNSQQQQQQQQPAFFVTASSLLAAPAGPSTQTRRENSYSGHLPAASEEVVAPGGDAAASGRKRPFDNDGDGRTASQSTGGTAPDVRGGKRQTTLLWASATARSSGSHPQVSGQSTQAGSGTATASTCGPARAAAAAAAGEASSRRTAAGGGSEGPSEQGELPLPGTGRQQEAAAEDGLVSMIHKVEYQAQLYKLLRERYAPLVGRSSAEDIEGQSVLEQRLNALEAEAVLKQRLPGQKPDKK